MKRQTLFRHLRVVVLFYKYHKTVEQIASVLSYSPLYVRKVLNSKPMKPYIMQLTDGFIEKARGHFDVMIAAMQAEEYTENKPE